MGVENILKIKVTTTRLIVKSMSHVDLAYLHPLTNVPTKYQLPTPYGFLRYDPEHILKVKVTTAG